MLSPVQEYIATCDAPTYLTHAERRLNEEVERVQAYLDATTEARLVKVRQSSGGGGGLARAAWRVKCALGAGVGLWGLFQDSDRAEVPSSQSAWRARHTSNLAAAAASALPHSLSSPHPQVVETELISRQMRALVDMENSGMVPMLQQDKYEDLYRQYALFKRCGVLKQPQGWCSRAGGVQAGGWLRARRSTRMWSAWWWVGLCCCCCFCCSVLPWLCVCV